MHVCRPSNLQHALQLLADAVRPLTPIAGGTDLMVSWHARPREDAAFLDLALLDELKSFRFTEDYLELGALTTYWQIIQSTQVADRFPLLCQTARQVGAIQIQTRGTWAGNIANGSPAADGVPVLMAYDAEVVLQSLEGTVQVPLHQYYTGYKQSVRKPDQLIVAIRLPNRTRQFDWFHKVGARRAQAITKVGVAMVHDSHGWRVVANSVAPTIRRCPSLEQALDRGLTFHGPDEVLACLSHDIAPITDIRSTAEYRANVLSRLIYHKLNDQTEKERPQADD